MDQSVDTHMNEYVPEKTGQGIKNRILQYLAQIVPGGNSIRVRLHRARGVRIGKDVRIGYDTILETSMPQLITLEDGVILSVRVTVMAHFWGVNGVRIEKDAFIGPGAIILPSVVIGHGAVVAAGSVVTKSVPPMTLVQGNPAVAVAKCGIPLTPVASKWSVVEFSRHLEPIRAKKSVPKPKA
jgi:acetyltransferase-like isoleucine patch superfamily enzyme